MNIGRERRAPFRDGADQWGGVALVFINDDARPRVARVERTVHARTRAACLLASPRGYCRLQSVASRPLARLYRTSSRPRPRSRTHLQFLQGRCSCASFTTNVYVYIHTPHKSSNQRKDVAVSVPFPFHSLERVAAE